MNVIRKDTAGIDLVADGIPGLMALMLRRRYAIIIGLVFGGLIGITLALALPKQYEAEATVIAASQLSSGPALGNLGQLASAASSFGVNLGADQADPSFLFPWILRNREVSARILLTKHVDRGGNEVQLIDRISKPGDNPTRRLARARIELHERVLRYEQDRRSGVSQVKVRLEDPVLASSVVNNCLEELDAFYHGLKSRMAGGEYGFIGQRLLHVEADLAAAEDALLGFRKTNRSIAGSPALLLEQERMEREVQLNQQLFLTLRTQLEIAGIEQEKQLPVLAVLDHGYPPVQPAAPRPVTLIMLWCFLGGALATVGVLVHNAILVYRGLAGK